MMEAVSRLFKISTTNFHITSTRLIPQYSPLPLGIRTTACHMDSSASSPSPEAALTRSTTFSQLDISAAVFSLF